MVPAWVASACGCDGWTCLSVPGSILGQFDLEIWKVTGVWGGREEGGCPQPMTETEVTCHPPHCHPVLRSWMWGQAGHKIVFSTLFHESSSKGFSHPVCFPCLFILGPPSPGICWVGWEQVAGGG